MQAYVDEFCFRFNRRASRQRGLLFCQLLEQAVEDRTDDELRKRATDAEARLGLLAQSVLLTPESDVVHVCQSDGRVSRYGQVNLSTVARLRRAGFALLPTLDAPHYSAVLPDVSPETLQRFRSCFDPAQPNPPSTLPG